MKKTVKSLPSKLETGGGLGGESGTPIIRDVKGLCSKSTLRHVNTGWGVGGGGDSITS